MSYCIVANVKSDRILRTGAKVYILHVNGDAAHPFVRGISKIGRYLTKYMAYKRLENFRAAWIPDHLKDYVRRSWSDKAEAQAVADALNEMWKDVRYFNRDGTRQVGEGVTEGEAYKRAESIPLLGFKHYGNNVVSYACMPNERYTVYEKEFVGPWRCPGWCP